MLESSNWRTQSVLLSLDSEFIHNMNLMLQAISKFEFKMNQVSKNKRPVITKIGQGVYNGFVFNGKRSIQSKS